MSDLDNRLGDSLKTVSAALRASRAERAIGARADFRRRLRRRRVTHFASLATAAGVMSAAVVVAATQGTNLFERTDRNPSIPGPAAGTYIGVGEDPVSVSVGSNTVWVASSAGTVTRVNPSTNRSSGVIQTGGEPSDIALAEDRAWYSDSAIGTVRPLDAESGRYADDPTSIGSQGRHIDVDVGPQGVVWATSYDSGMLIGINPSTGEIQNRLPVNRPIELAIAPGSLWALVDDGGSLVRYDFETSAEVGRVSLNDTAKTDLAVTSAAVYVAEADGTVVRIDSRTGEITARGSVGGTNPELAVGRGGLWVASDGEGVEAELAQLSLDRLRSLADPRTFLGAPTDVAASEGSIWVSETGRDTLVRIKAR